MELEQLHFFTAPSFAAALKGGEDDDRDYHSD